MMERAVTQDITALYDLIRDVLIAKAFLYVNCPLIDENDQRIEEEEERIGKLGAWLRHLASL